MLFGLLFSMKSEAANVTAFLAALLLIQLLIGYFVFIWETRKNAISNWTLNRFNHFMVVSLHWLNEISGRQGNLTTSEELKQFDYSRKTFICLLVETWLRRPVPFSWLCITQLTPYPIFYSIQQKRIKKQYIAELSDVMVCSYF